MIALTLPLPPNSNHYRGVDHARKRIFVRKPGLAYRETVKALALAHGIRDPIEGDIAVSLVIYRARKAGDIDGFLKVALDAMQNAVYVNDKQIVKLTAERRDDKHNPRLEVSVEAYAPV